MGVFSLFLFIVLDVAIDVLCATSYWRVKMQKLGKIIGKTKKQLIHTKMVHRNALDKNSYYNEGHKEYSQR